MFEVDGSQKSGSGTILRLAVAIAAVRGEPLHIVNIRQNRPRPGLKPQHLEAVLTAAKLCDAKISGAKLDSKEVLFTPGKIHGGVFEAEIGTAGNIPMLLLTVLPMCLFAKESVELHVKKGGTDTSHAPTINYLRSVFLPALRRMGVEADLTVQRYGYYPKGNGEATLTVKPAENLKPLRLEEFGYLRSAKGVSVCTFLGARRVAERQANAATEHLASKGYDVDIKIMNDTSNPIQKGSSLTLWVETSGGALLGADAIGELKKTAEAVGREAAENLSVELAFKPTVDSHLADMLIPYVALANGTSSYLTRCISDHLDANIWLVERMLGVHFKVTRAGAVYKVEKLAES